jgi:RNA polymerase sigma factor (sigma-70 family)
MPNPQTPENEFIQRFLPLVPKIVGRMRHRIPRIFETADLVQSGRVGLVIAARTFDPSRGAGEPWAAEYWARQLIRREVLNAIGRKNWLYAKGRTTTGECTDLTVYDPPAEPAAEAPLNPVLAQAIESLPWRQRKVIELVYHRGLNHSEIARKRLTGVTRGKVISDHRKALATLRERLEAREALEAAA